MKEVILLGDSIRMGYQAEVIKNLKGKANVWAPEENCCDSKNTLNNLDKWLKDKHSDIIHINCGLHDMFLNEKGECRHSMEDYAETLKQIFKKLKEKNDKAKIIFALTSPVDEKRQVTSAYGRLVRRNSDVEAYNKEAIQIAKEFDIQINDINTPLKNTGVEKMLIDDGIHLNSDAARIIGNQVAKKIEEELVKIQ